MVNYYSLAFRFRVILLTLTFFAAFEKCKAILKGRLEQRFVDKCVRLLNLRDYFFKLFCF